MALIKATTIEDTPSRPPNENPKGRKAYRLRKAILEKVLEGPVAWTEEGFSFEEEDHRVQVILVGGLQRSVSHRGESLRWSFLPGPTRVDYSDQPICDEPVYVLGGDGTICRFNDPYDGRSLMWTRCAPLDEKLFRQKLRMLDNVLDAAQPLNTAFVELAGTGINQRRFWIQPDGTVRTTGSGGSGGQRCSFAFEKGKTSASWRVVFTPDDPTEADRFSPIEVCEYGPDRRPAFWVTPDGKFMYLPPPAEDGSQSLRFFDFWDKGQYYPPMVVPPGRPYWVSGSTMQFFDPSTQTLHLFGTSMGADILRCSSTPRRVLAPSQMGRQEIEPGVLLLLRVDGVELVTWSPSSSRGVLFPPDAGSANREIVGKSILAPWGDGPSLDEAALWRLNAVAEEGFVHLLWTTGAGTDEHRIMIRTFSISAGTFKDRTVPLSGRGVYELLGYNRPYFVLLQKAPTPSLVFFNEATRVERVTPLPASADDATASYCRIVWGEEELYPLDSGPFWAIYK